MNRKASKEIPYINIPAGYEPLYPCVPPIWAIPFEHHPWVKAYCVHGPNSDGFSLQDRGQFNQWLNIENPTREDYDGAVVLWLVQRRYNKKAIKEFFMRSDVRLSWPEMPHGYVANLYEKAFNQYKALHETTLQSVGKGAVMRQVLETLNSRIGKPLHESKDIFYMVYILNKMVNECDPNLLQALYDLKWPVFERGSMLGLRLTLCSEITARYCAVLDMRAPDLRLIRKEVNVASDLREAWIYKSNVQCRLPIMSAATGRLTTNNDRGNSVRIAFLSLEWMRAAKLWDGLPSQPLWAAFSFKYGVGVQAALDRTYFRDYNTGQAIRLPALEYSSQNSIDEKKNEVNKQATPGANLETPGKTQE